MEDTNNILSVLDNYTLDSAEDISREIADSFRKRRIEKNLTREEVALRSGVAASNIARFEQKGLISLKHLINIAMTLGYTSEVRSLFAQPKYSTMEELTQIRRNSNKKRAHKTKKKSHRLMRRSHPIRNSEITTTLPHVNSAPRSTALR